MKAIVYREYGSPDVMKPEDVPTPVPAKSQVLVKIHAAAVNAADWHLLRADPFMVRFFFGLFKPKHPILGSDLAGVVEAVGEGVTRFAPGDAVFGNTSDVGCGAFAEFVCAPETSLVKKPAGISFEQAAAVPMAAMTALQALRDNAKLQPGRKVLINGASGGVGSFAVQLAKVMGADVTAVCSTKKAEMVRALGADRVVDYTREDFATGRSRYDAILAANGCRSIFDYRRALEPRGVYVMSGGAPSQMYQAMTLGPLLSLFDGRKMGNMLQKNKLDDLEYLNGLLERGKLAPVIDRTYPLDETPDAVRYVEAGHATGKVVIAVA